MPPITLISNAKDNYFYNTYTKEKLDISDIDFEYIKKLLENSFELALNDFKEAINILLNKDSDIFSRV